MNANAPPQHDRTGLAAAFAAYIVWGFLPLYLILVKTVPALEFVGWRIICTLPLCILIALVRKQWPDLRAALANRRTMGWLSISATLIGMNWVVYVWAIQMGEVYAASLGYYINPLINVLLGTILLGERLTRPQWAAVGIAAIGVSLLAAGALTTLWISLALALTFGCYGLIRKQVDVGSVPGLTIESLLLLLPSAGITWYFAQSQGSSIAISTELTLAIMLGGVLTAVPLLMFAVAARKLPYSTMGFIQFLAPSIVFILGLTAFDKPLHPVEIACFACIWAAAGIFVWDLVARSRKPAAS
ncbi:EamA family transporter RarD [Qipengyuania qiaonensis]|uniref:EamA family transporter RarD n=1 Tax=Qipengyuania qiaonensis TaxID=2867240 RepID=A0ABS7J6V9_9SPHN|nr:EamA family transporter RarD [Qipengyuania qiaonensis]MBX7483056.1 EamA family transporter RarD [Qipengyuania qiaonensis]